ncbi:MAG: XdhC family protein [Pirellulales bacterium]
MTVIPLSRDIHEAIVQRCDRGEPFAVAVVLKAQGSTPRKTGVTAIIDSAGVIQGTIGGGAVEAEAQRVAVEAIRAGVPRAFDFRLAGGAVADRDPLCGGAMRVLVDPTAQRRRAAYAAAVEARNARKRGVLLTSVRGGAAPEVDVQYLAEEAIAAAAGFPGPTAIAEALARQEAALFVAESLPDSQPLEVLVEPLVPDPVLVIVGGGHIGQALAAAAGPLGFEILVLDDRPEFTAEDLFPEGVTTRCGPVVEEINRLPIDAATYVVIVTRGHRHDAEALAACIHKPAAYLGMIGSRRKVALVRKEWIEAGRATAAEFDRVYAPVGLDLGAATVPEIAVSIAAQLIAVRRTGSAPRIAREPGS